MQTRPLGKTPLQVSRLSLGTMTFGSQVDEPTARTIVDQCLEHGINFLDTANAYNAGKTEEILGRILAGRRDRVVLASKVCNKMGEAPDEQGLSPAAIKKAIEESLRRLRTDYLDLYYMHQPDYATPIEDTLSAMNDLVRAGKVRYVAASNYAAWRVCRMLWLAEKNGWQPIAAVQPMYNLLARRIERELLPFCTEQQLAVVPYNPLAGGLLTGKHQAAAPIPGTRFDRLPFYRDRYWHAENFAAVERLKQVALDAGRSLVDLSILWLLQKPTVTSIILGVSSLDHLAAALAAAEKPPLSKETLAACDEVWDQLRGVAPNYNR